MQSSYCHGPSLQVSQLAHISTLTYCVCRIITPTMQIKMAAVNLLEQLSKSSETAGHNDLGGALRYFSMEFRQFVIGEANNHVPSDDADDDESPAKNLSNATLSRRHKSENGTSLAKSAREWCRDGDLQWPQNGGPHSSLPKCKDDDVVKDLPHCRSQTSLDMTRLQNLQPDAISKFHPSRAPETTVTCSSYGGPGHQIVASARNTQLTFVKPDAADGQYSMMMRLPPSLTPSAPEERDIFGGKVGVYLLKNAGSLKVRFAVLTYIYPVTTEPLSCDNRIVNGS